MNDLIKRMLTVAALLTFAFAAGSAQAGVNVQCPGDTDGDGDIDLADVVTFQSLFTGSR